MNVLASRLEWWLDLGFLVAERQESLMMKNVITNRVRNARACGMVASLSLQHDVVYISAIKAVFFAFLYDLGPRSISNTAVRVL